MLSTASLSVHTAAEGGMGQSVDSGLCLDKEIIFVDMGSALLPPSVRVGDQVLCSCMSDTIHRVLKGSIAVMCLIIATSHSHSSWQYTMNFLVSISLSGSFPTIIVCMVSHIAT